MKKQKDMMAAVCNMGCKVNSYEAQGMTELLEKAGYQIVDFHEKADIYLINTCTVTQIAAKKSRQMIHRARKLNPDALIIAAGCYVDRDDSLVQEGIIDIAIPNQHKADLLAYIEAFQMGKEPRFSEESSLWITENEGKSRAFLKVQDGCRQFCTYCIIPFVRGPLKSRPIALCRKEAEGLAQKGYSEVVLTGIHLSSYGKGENDGDLADLILAISEIPKIQRIRLGSMEPRMITPQFIEKVKKTSKLCPHFHLSLQSGSDVTLKAMNRRYTPAEYQTAVELLRAAYPDVAITTDIIVGFPGETEEEHRASMDFVARIGFAEAHVFRYSKMEGTAAARRTDQIAPEIKKRRSEEMLQITAAASEAFMERMKGKQVPVLLEEQDQETGIWTGYTPNYMKVAVHAAQSAAQNLQGKEVQVVLQGYEMMRSTNHEASGLEKILKGVQQ